MYLNYIVEGRHYPDLGAGTLIDYFVTVYNEDDCETLTKKGFYFKPGLHVSMNETVYERLKGVFKETGMIGMRKDIVI